MIYNCLFCKKIIIKDIVSYIKKYPNEKYIQCPYCGYHIPTEKIKEDLIKNVK